MVTCRPEMLIRWLTPVRANNLPFVGLDGALVADRKRDQHARVALAGQRLPEFFPDRLAQMLDPVLRPVYELGEAFAFAFRTHIAGRPDAALEQPGFIVESVRVGAAVRPPQAQRKAPALARAHRRDLLEFLL